MLTELVQHPSFWLMVAISIASLLLVRLYRGALLITRASGDPPHIARLYIPTALLAAMPISVAVKWLLAAILALQAGVWPALVALAIIQAVATLTPFPYRVFTPIFLAQIERVEAKEPNLGRAMRETLELDWPRAWWFDFSPR